MEAFLIFRQPDNKELTTIETALQRSNSFAVTGPGISISTPGIPSVKLSPEIIRKANQDLLDAILAFGDRTIDGTAFSSLINPGNFPIWHYQRFRIYFKLRPLFVLRAAIDHYLSQGCRVAVFCDEVYTKNLNRIIEKLQIVPGPISKKAKLNLTALFNYAVYFKIRVLIGLFLPPVLKSKKHLLVDRSVKQLCRHIKTLEPKYDNYNLSNLFDTAGNDFLILSEVEMPKLRGNGSFRLNSNLFAGQGRRSSTINGEYLLFRGLLSAGIYRKKKKILAHLNAAIKQLDKEKLSEVEYIIFNAFRQLSPTNSFFITRYLSFQRFFRKHPMLTASAIDENSPATRCILDAARSTGSVTFGIQHGNIGDAQPAYLYTPTDREHHIMADYTLVWGEYWKEFLVGKGNFPSDSVIITGQIRTDIIPRLLKDNDELRAEFAAKKPIAVFASQPIPDPVVRHRAALDVFTAFKNLPDFELIVKLHPGEKDAIDYYRKIAIEAGCEDYRLLYDVDLYSLLAVSDLVITCYSTVGTEAIYFAKPLLILDYEKEDLLGYHAAGIAWQVSDPVELENISRKLLTKELVPDMDAYRNFIARYSNSIDGRATERTIDAIREVKSGTDR